MIYFHVKKTSIKSLRRIYIYKHTHTTTTTTTTTDKDRQKATTMTRQQQLDEKKPCLFLPQSFTHSHNLFFFSFLYPQFFLSLSLKFNGRDSLFESPNSNPNLMYSFLLFLFLQAPFHPPRIFLGSTQTLRPLRSRTNHRRTKLGLLQFQSPQFLIRASLDSRSVLIVVAVDTFSAISVLFLNRYRRKNNDREVREL